MTISEERRLVTVLFVDMVGFTGRTESSDPEVVRDIQRTYFETVAAEIERYGGTVEKYIGDAVMAIFGAPRAHGDDPERALRAALGIRDAIQERHGELEIRIGVDTGEVVGGAAPGAHAAEYTVTGDAVNVAARLQQAAEPGEIVVGASTRRSAAEAFDFAPMPPLDLKGKAAPVEAWRLVRALPDRPRVRGSETPLGRSPARAGDAGGSPRRGGRGARDPGRTVGRGGDRQVAPGARASQPGDGDGLRYRVDHGPVLRRLLPVPRG